MKFSISRGTFGWDISPVSGAFAGERIATATGVCMRGIEFKDRTAVGEIKALWGAEIDERAIDDAETRRGLSINGIFDTQLPTELMLDTDGFCDVFGRRLNGAARLVLIDKIMAANVT